MRLQLRGWVIQAGIGVISLGVGVGVGYYLGKKQRPPAPLTPAEEELKSQQLELDFKRMEMDREFNFQIGQASHVLKELKEQLLILHGILGTPTNEEIKRAVDLLPPPSPAEAEHSDIKESVDNHPSNNLRTKRWPEDDERINEPRKVTIIPLLSKTREEDESDIMINVFPDNNDVWDYDEEVKHRTPERPYIIHRDEYFSDEMGFSQTTITFYAGDRILCDEEDVPIYNPDAIVGRLIFGHGSRDESICYIRNERLQAEYEVMLDSGYFQSEVLGNPQPTPNLKHSHPRRVPKFKKE